MTLCVQYGINVVSLNTVKHYGDELNFWYSLVGSLSCCYYNVYEYIKFPDKIPTRILTPSVHKTYYVREKLNIFIFLIHRNNLSMASSLSFVSVGLRSNSD